MKQFLHYSLLIFFLLHANNYVYAQTSKTRNTHMWRISEDNDFLNIRGHGTDEAYSNGLRIDYFYSKNNDPAFLLNRIFLKAGNNSINIRGWGITQLIFTPRNITTPEYQPTDYSYSGALYVTRSLYSYNPIKKYSLQTEVMIGVRGPAAFAKETQRFIHGLINYQKPNGWDHQLRNKVILNINVAEEKQIFSDDKSFEVIGGLKISAGTLLNTVTVYPLIRIGKIHSYFKGLLDQYYDPGGPSDQIKLYLIVKPQLILTATNSLLTDNDETVNSKIKNSNTVQHELKRSVLTLDAGITVSIKRFSISFTQNWTGALMEHSYKHEVGNISLSFSR